MNEETLRPTEAVPTEEPLMIETEQAEDTVLEAAVTAQPSAAESEEYAAAQDAVPADITHRLADEFFSLREEFPTIHSPEQLPDAVLDMAVNNGIPLFDAYLRFRHEEEKRVRLEEERRRLAAARSAGSLMQGAAQADPEQEAFLRAFRTALK